MNIGSQIKEKRKEKRLTQEELANMIGTYGSAIRRYESGRVQPRIDTLERIARALDCSVIDLMR